MTTSIFYKVFTCFIASILIVFLLYKLSSKPNDQANGFVRLFPPHLIGYHAKKDLGFNSYYIAGTTSHKVYFGNTVSTAELLTSNMELNDTSHLKLSINSKGTIAWGALKAYVDSPFVYLSEGILPNFFYGKLDDTIHHLANKAVHPYSKIQPLSLNNYIVRVYDTSYAGNILMKLNVASNTAPKQQFPLTKQSDGIFSSDGMLLYNKDSAFVLYVYYYRNEFIRLDTNLQVRYIKHTIDTTSQPHIETITDSSTGQTRMHKPPLFVNKRTFATSRYLFINSGLLATNEDRSTFDQFSVIDAYDIRTGVYQFSFYIPDYKGIRASSFYVKEKYLIALYDRFVVSYTVNF